MRHSRTTTKAHSSRVQAHLSNDDLTGFTLENFEEVRVGMSAYGYHLFGRLRIPALPEDGPCYIFLSVSLFSCYSTPIFVLWNVPECITLGSAGGD